MRGGDSRHAPERNLTSHTGPPTREALSTNRSYTAPTACAFALLRERQRRIAKSLTHRWFGQNEMSRTHMSAFGTAFQGDASYFLLSAWSSQTPPLEETAHHVFRIADHSEPTFVSPPESSQYPHLNFVQLRFCEPFFQYKQR